MYSEIQGLATTIFSDDNELVILTRIIKLQFTRATTVVRSSTGVRLDSSLLQTDSEVLVQLKFLAMKIFKIRFPLNSPLLLPLSILPLSMFKITNLWHFTDNSRCETIEEEKMFYSSVSSGRHIGISGTILVFSV